MILDIYGLLIGFRVLRGVRVVIECVKGFLSGGCLCFRYVFFGLRVYKMITFLFEWDIEGGAWL